MAGILLGRNSQIRQTSTRDGQVSYLVNRGILARYLLDGDRQLSYGEPSILYQTPRLSKQCSRVHSINLTVLELNSDV